MQKEYNNYVEILNTIQISDLSEIGKVSEDMIRKYKTGRNLPRLDTAVEFEKIYNIPCSFWVEHNKNYKEINKKND